MTYQEGIRRFALIRDYIRDFLVYGFHTRNTIGKKSTRSYDDMRRRVSSWLKDAVVFRQDQEGRHVYLSFDTRTIPHNPLYQAFKARSFTDLDITLFFCLLDLLQENTLSFAEIMEQLNRYDLAVLPDESTVRAKLQKLVKRGLVQKKKTGKKYVYTAAADTIPQERWKEAVSFAAETEPCGVIGSYIMDAWNQEENLFTYKHAYFIHALESEILYGMIQCADENREAVLAMATNQGRKEIAVQPGRIYLSTETGREYVLGWCEAENRFRFFRLDHILRVKKGGIITADHKEELKAFTQNLWGVSSGHGTVHHLKLTIHAGPEEGYIEERLMREKRNGTVMKIDAETYVYETDTWDPAEMIPWLRTFIGRMEALECDDEAMMARFREDLQAMKRLYGGEDAL